MTTNDATQSYSRVVDELHVELNNAVAAVAAMAAVLRLVAEQSAEPEIRRVAEETLRGPTVASVLVARRKRR